MFTADLNKSNLISAYNNKEKETQNVRENWKENAEMRNELKTREMQKHAEWEYKTKMKNV